VHPFFCRDGDMQAVSFIQMKLLSWGTISPRLTMATIMLASAESIHPILFPQRLTLDFKFPYLHQSVSKVFNGVE
jgi:hypothetical protein